MKNFPNFLKSYLIHITSYTPKILTQIELKYISIIGNSKFKDIFRYTSTAKVYYLSDFIM